MKWSRLIYIIFISGFLFLRNGLSKIFSGWLSKLVEKSEEELKRIIDGCNQFDDDEICLDAAMEFAKIKKVDF